MQKEVYEFISQQKQDPIVAWETCKRSGQEFPLFLSDEAFFHKVAPRFGGVSYPIPQPTLCPDLRHMRRMCFRNDRSLYKSVCKKSGKGIISMFDPSKNCNIYERNLRRSDDWSALNYGCNFDFSRTLHDQMDDLLHRVPLPNLLNSNSHNSSYVNQTDNMKNCYLVFSCCDCEHCYYGNRLFNCNFCMDCSVLYNSEYCYECIDGNNLNSCFFCQYAQDCSQSYFLFDCHNCHQCYGCRNLSGKKYHIYNTAYTPEAYHKKINELKRQLGSRSGLDKAKHDFQQILNTKAAHRACHIQQSENTRGGFLSNCTGVLNCFEADELEDCKDCLLVRQVKDIRDSNNTVDAHLQYEVSTGGINAYRQLFCLDCRPNSHDLLYCMYCANSAHSIACIGLKQQSYCILNTSYTQLDWEKLAVKIIHHLQETGERGEFFDPSLSPFGFNESAGYEYYPVSAQQAQEWGFPWHINKQPKQKSPKETQVPDSINQVQDEIVGKPLSCKESNKVYQITHQELMLHRRFDISLSCYHPDIRHQHRFQKKPSRNLRLHGNQTKGKSFLSVYPPDVQFKVYAEEAYRKEVFG